MVAHLFVMSAVQTQHHQGWWHRYKNPWLGAWNQCARVRVFRGEGSRMNLWKFDWSWLQSSAYFLRSLAILKVAYFSILLQESGILHYEPTFPAARPHVCWDLSWQPGPHGPVWTFLPRGGRIGAGSDLWRWLQTAAACRAAQEADHPGRHAWEVAGILGGPGAGGDVECHQLQEILDRAEFEGLNFGHVCFWRFPFKGWYLQIHSKKSCSLIIHWGVALW